MAMAADFHQQNVHQRNGHGAHERNQIQARAAGDAHCHGPEQKAHIQRILDRGAVTHNGQRTDHTKRQNHVGTDDDYDEACDQAGHHQQNVEVVIVDHAFEEEAINRIDDHAAHERRQQRHDKPLGREVARLLQKAAFENIRKIGHRYNILLLSTRHITYFEMAHLLVIAVCRISSTKDGMKSSYFTSRTIRSFSSTRLVT